ncbi:DUF2572 family protein [Clostridium chromiireducens]|uniref:DUF2572 family protein n=1 Tax=Clostridium chromiireducens TaxID=225345 RepID=A0A964RIX3_9CLOT|nr:DUF2572 family protein [Clostridium chromiireducens]MVX62577.1 DUF2572 family protein [Clostridium chromiireducens]
MRRKKKGSSLIYVIIIFMFVSTVSTAMISMISANYRARTVENKRVENLYGSDSGIYVAYNIMGKTFDAATKYGFYRVKTVMDEDSTDIDKQKCTYVDKYKDLNTDIKDLNKKIDDLKKENDKDTTNADTIKANNGTIDRYYQLIEDDKNFIQVLLNEEFKNGFREFFEERYGQLDSDFKLTKSVKDKKYDQVNGLNDIVRSAVEYGANEDIHKEANLDVVITIPNNVNDDPNYGITSLTDGHTQPVVFTKTVNKAYGIKIISDFKSTNMSESVGDNNRTVEVNYVMKIPNYDDIFFGKSTSSDKYLALEGRGLTVGGNMNVENVNSLNIIGNIFVEGHPDSNVIQSDNTQNRTYQKYDGGIKINNSNSGSVAFSGDVVTRNTFNIQDKTSTGIDGNLYARNAYIGKIAEGDSGFAQDSSLNIENGQIIVDNDLTVKAKASTIIMSDFYGINDKNINYDDLNPDSSQHNIIRNGKNEGGSYPSNIAKSSSSIIINASKAENSGSKITIKNSAYIMGTAHIATNSNYQTGESGAVKGNYVAYSVLNPADTSETLGYDNLLNEDNVFKKAEHFKNYWTSQGNADPGGIIWPPDPTNIHSVGAIVYDVGGNKSILKPNYNADLEKSGLTYDSSGEICKKRIDFESKVNKFGQPAQIGEYNNSIFTDFNSLMTLTELPNDYDLNQEKVRAGEKAIFNNDEGTTLVLQDEDTHTTEYKDSDRTTIKTSIIKADSNNNINAVIASAGNVIIDGDVTIKGTIVCNGNLDIKDNNSVTINHNPEIVSRIQSQHNDWFKAVFGGMIIKKDGASKPDKPEAEILNNSYDINKFLETKLWKLKK